MRNIPSPERTPLNANDGLYGGLGQKKRQFLSYNQHYLSHQILKPDRDLLAIN